MVIAAEVPTVGAEALPEIESKLRSLDVYSAWRLAPMCRWESRTPSRTSIWTRSSA